jgi:hypothetical protein
MQTTIDPWTCAELRAIIKDLPTPKPNLKIFIEELIILLGAYHRRVM